MTMKIRVFNDDPGRLLIVEPFDMAGDPPEPVSAGAISILPGQSAVLHVHSLRSLQVYEGEVAQAGRAVGDEAPAPSAEADAGADKEGAGATGQAAA